MAQQKTLIDQYRDHLTRVGKSPHTVRAYSLQILQRAHPVTLHSQRSKSLSLIAVTSLSMLIWVVGRKPLTTGRFTKDLICRDKGERWQLCLD